MRIPAVNSPLRAFAITILLSASVGSLPTWAASSGKPAKANAAPPAGTSEISIPGPLRSFLRMAGISQKISQDDVMPLLARNVYMQGYEGGNRPT